MHAFKTRRQGCWGRYSPALFDVNRLHQRLQSHDHSCPSATSTLAPPPGAAGPASTCQLTRSSAGTCLSSSPAGCRSDASPLPRLPAPARPHAAGGPALAFEVPAHLGLAATHGVLQHVIKLLVPVDSAGSTCSSGGATGQTQQATKLDCCCCACCKLPRRPPHTSVAFGSPWQLHSLAPR